MNLDQLKTDSSQLSINDKDDLNLWTQGFEAMGNDPDCNDVEFAIPAQSEIVLGQN